MGSKVYKLSFLKFPVKYFRNDESTVLIAMMVQNLLKLWQHFTENTDLMAKMIPRNNVLYGTVY